MKLRELVKKLNFWDSVIVGFAVLTVGLFGYSVYAKAAQPLAKTIEIKVKAGNLYQEVAYSISAGDFIVDRDGRPFFKISQIDELRNAKQAVVKWDGQMISADNPELYSVEFTAQSVNPKFKGSNLFYNWELVKPGRTMYMETEKTGFMAVIISVGEEK
ncbi:MAG TPA: hypothetical protein PL190_03520 [Caldisericia bacterium]|jgi:hypothetical protein|nr:hypothetical protein [Caldisericia bacterium]HNY61054.1 hypothetical protein [Caldisericia bacterium]HOC78986.1 hypothetical protein [Caldisericia bacterium]HOG69773.1 hypothetical protein [Caldisericia bacterium]HPA65583.1 hypothetical protein [Caldisericia bacterium]